MSCALPVATKSPEARAGKAAKSAKSAKAAKSESAYRIIDGTALSVGQKTDLLHRLARVEGQLRGVQKLVAQASNADDCEAVAQQMAAARKALDRSFVQLLCATVQTQTASAADLEQARAAGVRLAGMLDKFV